MITDDQAEEAFDRHFNHGEMGYCMNSDSDYAKGWMNCYKATRLTMEDLKVFLMKTYCVSESVVEQWFTDRVFYFQPKHILEFANSNHENAR